MSSTRAKMLALSSSWNADGRFTPRGFVSVVRELGLGAIELSYYHSAGELDELLRCCREAGIGIVGAHNYCPFPEGIKRGRSRSEILLISAADESERRKAVEATKRSIASAAALGAKVLVIHAGRVEMAQRTRELILLYRSGLKRTRRFNAVRDDMVRERAGRAARYLERVLKSIEELCPAASAAGVRLAVENRYYHREIPILDEVSVLLSAFKGAPVSYWHDIGHAQVLENLGFWQQEDWLKAAGDRLAGFHIHDVLMCEDHLPPSCGMVRFERFAGCWHSDKALVIELSPAHGRDAAQRGVDRVRAVLRSGQGAA